MRLQTPRQPNHYRTLKSQLVADRLATLLFTAMGLGVIAAVVGMMVFFMSTIIPLFAPVELELERLTVIGHRGPTQETLPEETPLAFVHDLDSAFMAEVYSSKGSCAVAQGVSVPGDPGSQRVERDDAGAPPRASGRWQVLGWRKVLWPSDSAAPTWSDMVSTSPLSAGDGGANGSARDSWLQCFALTRSRFVVVRTSPGPKTGTDAAQARHEVRLAVVETSVHRDFLGSQETTVLIPQLQKSLDRQGWLVLDDGRFLAKASAEAPVASLTTGLKALLSVGGGQGAGSEGAGPQNTLDSALARLFPAAEPGHAAASDLLASTQFVHDGVAPQGAAERHVLTVDLRGSASEEDLSTAGETLAILVNISENFLTGLKESEYRGVLLSASTRFVGIIAGGEHLLVQGGDGQVAKRSWSSLWSAAAQPGSAATGAAENLPRVDVADAPLALDLGQGALPAGDAGRSALTLAPGSAVLSYGGNTLVTIDGRGVCSAFDVSLFLLDQGSGMVQPRWRRQCGPPAASDSGASGARLFWRASPAQRIGLLVVDKAFAGIDFSTGDTLFTGEVPQALHQNGPFEVAFGQSGRFVQMRSPDAVAYFKLHAEHLEGSLGRLFRKIHYEGYRESSYSWQSAAATDDFEAKFSLWPLIWGTLKATLYAMLFAAPLGIFAAVYSSEILDRTTRNFIKPTIEMMASLPSVVLGYLAAIVLAPWIESNILGVLLCGMVLPCTLYFFGNMVSKYSAEHVSGRGLYASRRLLFIILVGFALAMAALLRLGRFIESLAFGGDLKAFLSGGEGSAAALYGILLLPLVLVSLWTIPAGRFVKSWRTLVFLAGPLLSFAIGYALHRSVGESTLSVAGYSQRNALVICVAMGFAIIPIIYSLAEDALTSVPGSLRAGSLACGASVWQTTARVVLPTAASGIFSALMVGFGRAIGETMIVVMATGNSPLMSINPFEGLRSLAANIAVELPEAPQGGSHYRILFFSGFLLFVLTFSMNTLAEFMRTRYRKRNKAL